MSKTVYRPLEADEVCVARQLSNRNPDIFAAYAIERLPTFYDIADALESVPAFIAKQQLLVGAFTDDALVGIVFVEPVVTPTEAETSEIDWESLYDRFSEHEVQVYCTLASDLSKAVIDAPSGSLLIHSICVERGYRGQGIGTRLLSEAISRLSPEQHKILHIKVARRKEHVRMCESLGFKVVRRRISLSDRLQFGCWGSTLLKFIPGNHRHAK